MEKLQELVSIRDNGLLLSINDLRSSSPREMSDEDWNKFFQEQGRGIGYQWFYQGYQQKVLWDQISYKVFDLLSDETGFLVFLDGYRSVEAKILNGDLSVRCTMHPTFNVRGLSDIELENVYKAKVQHYGRCDVEPYFKQQVRNNKKRTDGIIEIEGNDGITDCMYFFDAQTGALVGAEPFPWAD